MVDRHLGNNITGLINIPFADEVTIMLKFNINYKIYVKYMTFNVMSSGKIVVIGQNPTTTGRENNFHSIPKS